MDKRVSPLPQATRPQGRVKHGQQSDRYLKEGVHGRDSVIDEQFVNGLDGRRVAGQFKFGFRSEAAISQWHLRIPAAPSNYFKSNESGPVTSTQPSTPTTLAKISPMVFLLRSHPGGNKPVTPAMPLENTAFPFIMGVLIGASCL